MNISFGKILKHSFKRAQESRIFFFFKDKQFLWIATYMNGNYDLSFSQPRNVVRKLTGKPISITERHL